MIFCPICPKCDKENACMDENQSKFQVLEICCAATDFQNSPFSPNPIADWRNWSGLKGIYMYFSKGSKVLLLCEHFAE